MNFKICKNCANLEKCKAIFEDKKSLEDTKEKLCFLWKKEDWEKLGQHYGKK
jgi:hypothetical protein